MELIFAGEVGSGFRRVYTERLRWERIHTEGKDWSRYRTQETINGSGLKNGEQVGCRVQMDMLALHTKAAGGKMGKYIAVREEAVMS